jgi:F-type H+-transporting ATPase subunit b
MQHLSLFLVATDRPLINVDITLLANIALWFVLFFVLKAWFWGPMLDLFVAREEGIAGTRAVAQAVEAEARALQAQLDRDLKDARGAASAEREGLRKEGQRQEGEIVQAAQAEVTARVAKHREALAAQREALRAEVLAAVPGQAASLASRVLGREVRS